MSKAFTRESDSDESDETDVPEAPAVPQGNKNYITPRGAERLKEELRKLLYEERPSVVKTVSWAASNGDRSENGDYIYGKKRLREIDRRIGFLTKRIDGLTVVDPTQNPSDKVLFGASVTIQYENGVEKRIQIVGIDETDVARGKVSWISPIAKAVLNAKKGDSVTLKSPKGEEDLEIVKVEYVEID